MAPISLVARHALVLERSRFRDPAGSERAWEHAFHQSGLAVTALANEFLELEYEVVPDFLEICAELLCGRFTIVVVSCERTIFCSSKRGPRFEQCNLLVKDIGICDCSTISHWFRC